MSGPAEWRRHVAGFFLGVWSSVDLRCRLQGASLSLRDVQTVGRWSNTGSDFRVQNE